MTDELFLTLTGSWIRSCKLNRLSTWQNSTYNKFQITAHFSKNFAALVSSKQAKRSSVKKTRLNSPNENFVMKSFRLSSKRKLSILLNFLFPFVSFTVFFQSWNAKLWSWKPSHRMVNACLPFCWKWMSFTKVSNSFLPLPPEKHQTCAH